MISKTQWMWIFGIIILLVILVIIWVNKGKVVTSAGATNTNFGSLTDCNSLSYEEVLALQKRLNSKNCTDYEGKALVEDGLCGPRTNSAISKCNLK